MMEKILIIKKTKNSNIFKYLDFKDVESYYISNKENIIFKIFRKSHSFLFSIFFGNWKKKLTKYDKVILFDNGFQNIIAKYIKSKNPNIKIILWFWNPVISSSQLFLNNKYIDELWTYSKQDAKKYNMKYNTQFYTFNLKLKESNLKKDIIFLGTDKGRKNALLKLEDEFTKAGLQTDFYIIEKQEQYISYEEYLDMLAYNRAILDFNLSENSPLTLRVMEALFFQKKLVTNNVDIINYDFYHPNNIFILGKDKLENIHDFMKLPYHNLDDNIIEYYDFNNWLNRFGE